MRPTALFALLAAFTPVVVAGAEPYSIYNSATGAVSIGNIRGYQSIGISSVTRRWDFDLQVDYVTAPPISQRLRFHLDQPANDFVLCFPPEGESTFGIESVTFNRIVPAGDPLEHLRIFVIDATSVVYATPSYIPEPASLSIAVVGFAIIAFARRRE